MTNEFTLFRKFNDPALAEDVVMLLKANNIIYTVEEDVLSFDPSFSYNEELGKEYLIKIQPEDFAKAEDIITQHEREQVNTVAADHYLFGFTDEELKDVVLKTEEWSDFDQVLTRKILADRGHAIDEAALTQLRNKEIEQLRQPEKSQKNIIILGYVTALLGGLISLFIGWHLMNGKKTLPNGESVFAANEHDRTQGRIIFYLGLVVFSLIVIIRLINIT